MADDLRTIAEAVRDYHNPTSAEAIVAAFALAVLEAFEDYDRRVRGGHDGERPAFALGLAGDVRLAIEEAGRG